LQELKGDFMALPQNALSALDTKSKSSASSPAQPAVPAPQQAAPAGAQDDADKGDSSSDEEVAGKTNLLKLYSRLNAAIAELFQNLGVKPSLNMPHQAGQSMADHITDFGTALRGHGGITANLIVATHTRHDPKGGSTVSFPSEKLRQTIIPAKFPEAIMAVAACRTLVNKIAALVPDEPAAQQAKSQIALISQNEMSGMTAFDAGASLIALVHPLFQMLARRHQFYKNGQHHPNLTGPKQA
jgi:hypothetical protein